MPEYLTNTDELKSLADVIRTKGKTSSPLVYPDGFVSAISNISLEPALETREVTPTEEEQTLIPGAMYDAFSVIHVGAISSNYIGTAVPRKTLNDVSANGPTLTIPAGYYSLTQNAVDYIAQGSASMSDVYFNILPNITPYISEGYVTFTSESSVALNPVINTSGYISSFSAILHRNILSASYQLSIQSSTIFAPIESEQTILSAGTYVTSDIYVSPISSNYVGTGISRYNGHTFTISTSDQVLLSSYYIAADQIIPGDENLVASNIKEGVTIFSVIGTYNGIDPDLQAKEDALLYRRSSFFSSYYNPRITSVGQYMFFSMNGISIDFPNCLTVGPNAFYMASNVYNISLPLCEKVETCGFMNCRFNSTASILELSLCTSCESEAFFGTVISCISLPALPFVGEQVFEQTKASYIYLPECSYFSSSAFWGASITSLYAPKCVTVGAWACKGISLNTIDLPSCITIESHAFSQCKLSGSVYFPACETIGECAFESSPYITEINFPACISIACSAFYSCSSLNSVFLSVCKYIGSSAFNSCVNLTYISLPICEYIGYSAFYFTNIEQINFPKCNTIDECCFWHNSTLTTINLPECSSIGRAAFAYNSSLISVSIPMCSYLGPAAFRNCSNLQYIELPNVLSIGDTAFCSDFSLTYIDAPLCQNIASDVFYTCSVLASISFPLCKFIGTRAFYDCDGLTSVSFPACERIEASAFNNCTNLSYAYFPNCVYINTIAPFSNTHLEYVYFPKLTSGYATFRSCVFIRSINLDAVSEMNNFLETSYLTDISLSACTVLLQGAFAGKLNLQNVSIPSCEIINGYVFQGCNLETISLPKCSLISTHAFQSNVNLSSVYLLGSYVASLVGSYAFENTPLWEGNGTICSYVIIIFISNS